MPKLTAAYINEKYRLEMAVCDYQNVKATENDIEYDTDICALGDNLSLTVYEKSTGDVVDTLEDIASLTDEEIRNALEQLILNYEADLSSNIESLSESV